MVPVTSATLVLSYSPSGGHSKEMPVTNRRKVGMTSSHHGPYGQGYTRYNGRYKGLPSREGGVNPIKPIVVRIAVCNSMREVGSLVIVNQNVTVNTFPGLVHTARHTMGVGCSKSSQSNRKGDGYHGVIHDWG